MKSQDLDNLKLKLNILLNNISPDLIDDIEEDITRLRESSELVNQSSISDTENTSDRSSNHESGEENHSFDESILNYESNSEHLSERSSEEKSNSDDTEDDGERSSDDEESSKKFDIYIGKSDVKKTPDHLSNLPTLLRNDAIIRERARRNLKRKSTGSNHEVIAVKRRKIEEKKKTKFTFNIIRGETNNIKTLRFK